uniref:SpaH/EbpB family LPXTG-anchored major pilin n=1 Tax=Faecousia sp. TaxID=2952921 RepID=UPI004025EAF1
MKHTRQFFVLVLALVLTLGLCATAFADETRPGSITISNPAQGKTYEVFKLLDVAADESDLANKGFIYKLTNDDWATFITTVQDGSGAKYFNLFENGGKKYVLANENLKPGIADFAAKAKAYAEEKNLQPVQTATASDGNELTISGLDLGYYLVRSDLGILCSLDTTAPNAEVKEKNEATVIVKNVEDTKKQNVAEIGTYVKFTIQITVKDKAPVNYKLVDEMTEGLTFVNDENHPLTVTVNGSALAAENYNVAETTEPRGFTLTFNNNAEGSASILKTGDVVTVTYYAQINENAKIADEANVNKAKVEYGTNSHTEYDTTETYVWKMNIVKYTMKKAADGDQATEEKLAGATFELSRDAAGTQVIKLVKVNDTTYRLALPTETDTADDTITTGETGELVINGLADGTYYLTETKAPRGYNLLREPVNVTIGHKDANGKLTETSFVADQTETDTSGVVKVENNAGAELPSTGGIGTTVFYVLGSAMALGAVILLVTKKRMAA